MPNNELTALHKASMQNKPGYLNRETVTSEDLLDTYLGNTALLWGIANSSVSFVLALLNLPDTTHVNIKSTLSTHLNTPLILSVSKGWSHRATQGTERGAQNAIATKLLEKGAEVNAVDGGGRTALHYACLHRNLDAINALVKAGEVWDIKDKNGHTPLDFCCIDYETASTILEIATGGLKDYTYTLVKDDFVTSDIFYNSLSGLLGNNNQLVDVQPLKQAYAFNQKIDSALAPIYNHAGKLFEHYSTDGIFKNYAKSIMEEDSFSSSLFKISDSAGSRKLKALLTLYFSLKNTAFLNNELISTTKNKEIEKLVNNALQNPELMAERKLITQVGMAILNLVSILCAGLPLLVNYCITGQVFFSHQTKTEQLLNHFKDEMTTPSPQIGT